MHSKAHSALTAPLVLHHTRIYKCAMKKFGFNSHMRNEPFLIVIYHSSLVKGAMLRAFVNCTMVLKKRLSFFYFQWPKVDQMCNEYLRSYLNWWHNWQLKNRRRSHSLKGSHSMGDGRIFLKTHRDASFNKDLSNEPNFDRIHPLRRRMIFGMEITSTCLYYVHLTIIWKNKWTLDHTMCMFCYTVSNITISPIMYIVHTAYLR